MNILHVISNFPPAYSYGGPVKSSYEMAKQLVEMGHNVTVYTTDVLDSKSRYKFESNPIWLDGIEVYYFKNLSNKLAHKNFPLAFRMGLKLKENIQEFDIIHIHEYRSFQAIMVHHYAKKYKIPYVLQARGSVMPFFQNVMFKKVFDSIWGFNILKNAKMVLALTDNELNEYKIMGVNSDNIKIIPNGIDISVNDNIELGKFRQKNDISNSTKVILFLGRIHKIKGVDLLIESFSELIKDLIDVKLVIVGPDGGFLEDAKLLVKYLQIEEYTIFTGPLYGDEKMEVYSDADVYVLPSKHEGFPNTVLESCACGTPVVITDNCGISDIVNNFGYTTTFDKYSLTDAIKKALNDYSDKKNVVNLQKLLKEKFSIEKIVSDVEEIYMKIINDENNRKELKGQLGPNK